MKRESSTLIIWVAVVVLIILHQDNWLWTNDTLIFGFLPITLLFHMCISVAASITWWLATRLAWPTELDELESAPPEAGKGVKP